jgi:hypothetical protein
MGTRTRSTYRLIDIAKYEAELKMASIRERDVFPKSNRAVSG